MSVTHVLMFRHRPNLNDEIAVRHNRFVNTQTNVCEPWRIPNDGRASPSDIRGELVSVVNLDGVIGESLKGKIVYQLRRKNYLRDEGQYDDHFSIEFNAEKVNYANLVVDVFPSFVRAFESYRATIYEEEMAISDWMHIVEQARDRGKDVDGRDGVYRINSVNYFDRELCQRAFCLSPEKIVDRLQGKVESVSLLGDGVLIVYASKLLDSSELEKIDSEIRSLLS